MSNLRRGVSVWAGKPARTFLLGLLGLWSAFTRAAVVATPACPCTLAWDASADSRIAGYAVYYGRVGASMTNRLDAGTASTATLYNLTISSNYFFYVVAYDTNRSESNPSQTIFYRPPAMSPLHLETQPNGGLTLRFRTSPGATGSIQYSPSLLNPQWQTLATAMADTNGMVAIVDSISTGSPARYYRASR